MKKYIRTIALVLIVALAFSMIGCSLNSNTNQKLDLNKTALVVNGQEIPLRYVALMYITAYSQYEYYSQYYGFDLASESTIELIQDNAIDEIVYMNVVSAKASEYGVALSDTDTADVQAQLQTYIDSADEQIKTDAETKYSADSSKSVEAYTAELKADYITEFGISYDEYFEYLKDYLTKQKLCDLIQAAIESKIEVTDDQVTEWYNKKLEEQQTAYTDDPGSFKVDAETALGEGGTPIIYVPENYIRVKNLLIKPEEEIGEEYTTLSERITNISTEIGELIAYDEVFYAARIAELKLQLTQMKTEADTMLNEWLETAKTEAEEALNKAKTGEDFDALIEEYGADEGMTVDPAKTEGYVLGEARCSAADYIQVFKHAALQLQNVGDISELVPSENGWHIIKLVYKYTPGVVAMATIKDAIIAAIKAESITTQFSETTDDWTSAAKEDGSVVLSEDVYRAIGK